MDKSTKVGHLQAAKECIRLVNAESESGFDQQRLRVMMFVLEKIILELGVKINEESRIDHE